MLGTNYTVDQVYDRNNPCPWQPDGLPQQVFYSLNMSHPAGQLFYDSLYIQYAEWGVDFSKNDVRHKDTTHDLLRRSSRPLTLHSLPLLALNFRSVPLPPPLPPLSQCVYAQFVPEQIDAVAAAIDHSGREMLLSLSPGTDNISLVEVIAAEVSMYRVSDDTWDRWEQIKSHFLSALTVQPFIARPNGRYGLPSWPDLDMLPLGYIGIEARNISPLRMCNLTKEEQQTLMSLWTIFGSPLIYGGDLQHPDPFSLALITNTEALHITDHSTNNDFLPRPDNSTAVWRADSEQWQVDGISYFTVHNLLDTEQKVALTLTQLRGGQKAASQCIVHDVGIRADVGAFTSTQSFTLRPHASILYSLHNCTSSTTNIFLKVSETQTREAARVRRRE